MSKVIGVINGKEVRGMDLVTVEGIGCKSLAEDEILIAGSTEELDRDGEVILADGWDLKNYKKNPVILAGHDYHSPAIAKAVSVKVEDKRLMFKIKFPPMGDYPLADVYRKLYKGGFMNASSVGFRAQEWVDGDGKKTPYRTFTKTELLELSLVTVPANASALTEMRGVQDAVKKGVLNSEDVKALQDFAKQAIEGSKENGNDVKELPIVESNGTSTDGQDDHSVGSDERIKETEIAIAEANKKIDNVFNELKLQNDKVASLEATLAEYKQKVEGLEAKLVELSKSPKSYLDVPEPKVAVGVKEIADLASGIFK